MAARGGIPGLAVAMATTGVFLVYSGLRNVPILAGVRELATGHPPTGHPHAPTLVEYVGQTSDVVATAAPGGGTSSAGRAAIAQAAARYLGVPYVWAAADPTKGGVDCSGLVTYVLVHDIGLRNLPSLSHTVTQQFMVWKGAYTIPRDQCAAGDLVCWSGHIGIATGRDTMIDAPHTGAVVREERIWSAPAPVIRRVILPGDVKST